MPTIAVKSYDAKIDSKKRITLRNASYDINIKDFEV